ncbi:MAG: hypothetical protein QM723_07855 [Myxococcaceae bacterium]
MGELMNGVRWLIVSSALCLVVACSGTPSTDGGMGGGYATGGGSATGGGGAATGGGGAATGGGGAATGGGGGGAATGGGGAATGGGGAATGGGGAATGGGGAATGGGSATGGGGATDGGTGGGGGVTLCTTTATGSTHSSAIALAGDDSTLLTVNRDVGSVTAMAIAYDGGSPALTSLGELAVGAEPWSVTLDACGTTGYAVLRKEQKVVEITNLKTAPTVGRSVAVGSEATGIAITPNNKKLYVSNWVDGTVSVIDVATFTVTATVDLNVAIAATGLLGPVTARPALAHPRAIAITNNGDANDDDETVYVTEWFALRTAPESASGTGSDTNWKGLLYTIDAGTGAVSTIDLPPVMDTTFKDAKGQTTGCFPNQVGSVTIDGAFAYVTSTCASPVGPVGVFQFGACQVNANCAAFGALSTCDVSLGACTSSCTTDAQCGAGTFGTCNGNAVTAGTCKPFTDNAKTTTHPGLSIVDLAAGTATTTNLDALFASTTSTVSGTASTRMPLLPTDVGFRPGFGYVAAAGADAVFRLNITAGTITNVGSSVNNFITVHTSASAGTFSLPIGLAVSANQGVAFVANDGTRDVAALALNSQAMAGGSGTASSSSLPAVNSPEEKVLNGKRLFTTGLGRWSLGGGAWGSCAACHIDGLSDNVTWYFARGPRQTISLDGTYSKADPADQRILNWTAIFDEVADFEGNVRGISGGVGALVKVAPVACTVATQATDCPNSLICDPATLKCNLSNKDRINLLGETPQQLGLQGSTNELADPAGASAHPHSVIPDWLHIIEYVKQIRSPRAPTTLNAADVSAGATLFSSTSQGNCIGCHSGAKWTISKVFYTPGDVANDAFGSVASTSLSTRSWFPAASGFPTGLFPSSTSGKQMMRFGPPPTFEQLQCVLRPVGTSVANGVSPMGVSAAAIGVLEVRDNMSSGAQGAGGTNANDVGVGYNPPSLLGLQTGAPYFHAGNARTLEELLSATFTGHHQSAIANVFAPNAAQVQQLVAYLLSIDGSTTAIPVPVAGAGGGDICAYP